MSKRSNHSKRRQVPGTFRSHERKGIDSIAAVQRIVLYLPETVLDQAERQSLLTHSDTVQRYCEAVLIQSIQHEQEKSHNISEAKSHRFEEHRTIADDPDYLAEWTAAVVEQLHQSGTPQSTHRPQLLAEAQSEYEPPETIVEQPAAEVILRHAGLLGDDPNAFLYCLRRGSPLNPHTGPELIRALKKLESDYRGARHLDRQLCYALHKIAFEGQVLVTEGRQDFAIDEAIIDLLRLLQEAVDRVLSGQDIRYYSEPHDPSSPTQD